MTKYIKLHPKITRDDAGGEEAADSLGELQGSFRVAAAAGIQQSSIPLR